MEYYAINTSPSLSHFGILGMKWGIRRYQNKDGSLTEEGKRRYSSDSTPGIKEAKNALIKEDAKLKNIYKEYNKIVDIPESEITKYNAISQISEFALSGFEDMSLKEYANQAFLGAFEDSAQGNINPSTLRLYEKNILNNNTLSRISDMYDVEDEHLENARKVVSNVLRKNGIVDENINNYATNYIMYHRPVEIPETNTPMYEAAGSRPFSQYEKNTVNKVKNFSKGLKNQNDTNTWWYLNEAISNLGLDSIKCTDMTQSTWDKINDEISRLKSIQHSDLLYKDYLAHHGILGMKWGIRRYQNKDGSLTPAGMKRYNKLVSEANKLKPPSENQNGNDNNSNNYAHNKSLNNYSNEYLSRETQRLQLENNYMRQRNDTLRLISEYNRLKNPPKQKSEGRKFVENLLKETFKDILKASLKQMKNKNKNNNKNNNNNSNNNNNNNKKKNKTKTKTKPYTPPKKSSLSKPISYYSTYDVSHSINNIGYYGVRFKDNNLMHYNNGLFTYELIIKDQKRLANEVATGKIPLSEYESLHDVTWSYIMEHMVQDTPEYRRFIMDYGDIYRKGLEAGKRYRAKVIAGRANDMIGYKGHKNNSNDMKRKASKILCKVRSINGIATPQAVSVGTPQAVSVATPQSVTKPSTSQSLYTNYIRKRR